MSRSLAQSVGDVRRVAFVGLAKNTGKTVAVGALIEELTALRRPLAITSIGRDGEEFDVLHPRMTKPPVRCPAATLVATTAPMLKRSGAAHRVLADTGVQTPLGRVVIARLLESARIEVAGPSTATQIGAVVEDMLELGADHAIVDGSIDRRAAAAPDVADAVVISTGAVLGEDVAEVASVTDRALGLAHLPRVRDERLRRLAEGAEGKTLLVHGEEVTALPAGFALMAEAQTLPQALRPGAGGKPALVLGGVLPERLLQLLARQRRKSPVTLIAGDPTKVFVSTRAVAWYRERGLRIEVLRRAWLRAVTVNPTAPSSHRLDSRHLRESIAGLVRGRVPILDVRDRRYPRPRSAAAPAQSAAAAAAFAA
jgi:hypothetical protein